MCNHHPPAACLAYDRLFRQGAARDPSVRWDRMNEEISLARPPTGPQPNPARLGPAPTTLGPTHQAPTQLFGLPTPQQSRMSPTRPKGGRYANGLTSASACGRIAASRTSAGPPPAPGRTPARGAPSAPSELPGAHTPLRHAQFERELSQHPDKARVSKLLHGLRFGVRLGYTGPRQATFARNLPSAHEHPEAIGTELTKECAAGRILGPYPRPPVPRLHCSDLGAVPKKNGRKILHLSAPAGKCINDFIAKEDFTLQYASIIDAVQSLLTLGPGAQMAKVDLKSAFRMIPGPPGRLGTLGNAMERELLHGHLPTLRATIRPLPL